MRGRADRARVLTVIGTRPEGIKLAPVVKALHRLSSELENRVVVTGQHGEMLDQVLDSFGVARDYDLEIMQEGQDLHHVTAACLSGLRPVLDEFRPDVVLVQGDTASAFVGSLAAFYHGARVGHVEAGLRSGQKRAPFPEEMFRRLADVLSDFYFAPTPRAASQLRAEGTDPRSIYLTGNTVVDALLDVASGGREAHDPDVRRLCATRQRLVLVTIHRRESFGERLRELFRAVGEIADRHPDVEVVFPVHRNPNVRAPAREILGGRDRVHLLEPLDYLDLVTVLKSAALVLTDSGGIQEEAPTFGVPVLVLRDVTERLEAIEAGAAELVGTERSAITRAAGRLLGRPAGTHREVATNPFGDGKAAERIADILAHALRGRPRATTDWDGTASPLNASPGFAVPVPVDAQ